VVAVFREPRRRGRTRRDQSRRYASGRACRLLLCARSFLADRLHDRRQRGGEFGRRALPEIRHDHQQPARLRAGADDGRDRSRGRKASRRRGLRSPRHHYRLGGSARGRHRDHRAHSQEAGWRARRLGGVCLVRGCRRMREQGHRCWHHPRRHGDDGPPGNPPRRSCMRGIRSTSRRC